MNDQLQFNAQAKHKASSIFFCVDFDIDIAHNKANDNAKSTYTDNVKPRLFRQREKIVRCCNLYCLN